MAGKQGTRGHTGHTDTGHVRDVRVERIGRVTIYKRGKTYSLYYREQGRSVRRKVDGNLASARALASKANALLAEGSPSLFGFSRTTVIELLDGFLEHCEMVQELAPRTVDRYRAALAHFRSFVAERMPSRKADEVTVRDVEDFVKWLRAARRTRNGATNGHAAAYSSSGRAFILSTCRTAFNWGKKRRRLPPYEENPFTAFGVEKPRTQEGGGADMLTPEQQQAFFAACDEWQRPLFFMLALYGFRVGELTHLLISDVDLREGRLEVRSKPEMLWWVKTQRERGLPVPSELRPLFERLIGGRREGFVFLNRPYAEGKRQPLREFASRHALNQHLASLAGQAEVDADAPPQAAARAVKAFLRAMGQIPEKRIRQEYMKLTRAIGCPELTRAHSFRHLFSTRVQEQGTSPLLVQGMLGHATLDMTRHYTHFGMDAKSHALSQMLQADPTFRRIAGLKES